MGYEWKDSLKGAGKGAQAGSFGGPLGMLIGALAGGAIGGFGDDLDKRITGDSQNNITDQMLNLGVMAGSMGSMGGGSGFGGAGSAASSGIASGMPNLEFADGSGRYLSGNSPLGGSSVDGNFLGDLGGMFGQGGFGSQGGMSPQMSGGMDPNSFDWSSILKMLGSGGMGQEQQQPMGGMVPRMPSMMPQINTSPAKGEGYYQTWLVKNNLA